jgi:hypothetical protein
MEHVTSTGKDTIYVDVDDEITTIIDKVRSSHARIVALVLPKRATMLQSIVNMKLLKHAAEGAKKHLVLITSEASLLPLAGAVELYVAKTLQSKPEVPLAPDLPSHAEDAEEALHLDDDTPEVASARKAVTAATKDKGKLDARKSVGELAAGTIAAESIDDAIDLDNDDGMGSGELAGAVDKVMKSKKKPKGNKKLRIPNFDKFRMLLIFGGVGLVALIVLLVVCVKVLPKATITIDTDRQAVNISPTLTLSTTASSANTTSNTLPAQSQQTQKTLSAQVNTTGQQNNGQKASGAVTLTLNDCANNSVTIPAGSGVVSGTNITFITQASVTLQSVSIGGHCQNSQYHSFSSATVNVVAQTAGTNGNVNASMGFTVSGFSDVTGASNAAFTGGTDSIIQIVAQADVDSATSKLGTVDTNAVKQQLENSLKAAGEYPIVGSFTAATPATSQSAQVGDQATTLTVTQQITYTMLGVKQSDLEQDIKANVGQQVDVSKQDIVDYGLSSASFSQPSASTNAMTISLQDTAVVGASLNVTQIAQSVAGKKTADATSTIKSNPGVTNVSVKYSPFWVSSMPGNAKKITVHIDQPKTVSNG